MRILKGAALALAISATAFAQEPPSEARPVVSKECGERFGQLASAVDISVLFPKLRMPPLKKGEFETSEEFAARQSKVVAEKLRAAGLSSPIILTAHKYAGEYDADLGAFVIKTYDQLRGDETPAEVSASKLIGDFAAGNAWWFGSDDCPGDDCFGLVFVRSESTSKSGYVGQTAGGAKRRVENRLVRDLGLGPILDGGGDSPYGLNAKIPAHLAISRDEALHIKPALKVYLCSRLVAPLTGSTESLMSPRFDNPVRTESHTYFVTSQTLAYAIADAKTGKIYQSGALPTFGEEGQVSSSLGEFSGLLSKDGGQPTADTDWLAQPTADEFARYYPDRAQRLERSGSAVLRCQVGHDGALQACSVVSEDPPDLGFGDAALRMSKLYKMRLGKTPSQPTTGVITVKVPFTLPK